MLLAQLPHPDRPLVAEGLATQWPCCRFWTMQSLSTRLHHPLRFRLSRKDATEVQWETDCSYELASIVQFEEWLSGVPEAGNALSNYPLKSWWAYADYLYMEECHDDGMKDLANDLEWTTSFPCLKSAIANNTFWLGSAGTYTACHYDTYGVNLVAQVFGEKTWTLFPPSDSMYLYPTRLPLEESTVFSAVNIREPNLTKHPLVAKTTPHRVVLKPGDVLFVPRGWWHFVQSPDDGSSVTCSVNLWLDQPKLDNRVRWKEALTQLSAFSLLRSCSSVTCSQMMHAKEYELFESQDWNSRLLSLVNRFLPHNDRGNPDGTQSSYAISISKTAQSSCWTCVEAKSFSDLFKVADQCSKISKQKELSTEQIIRAFLQPDVIELVARHLEDC